MRLSDARVCAGGGGKSWSPSGFDRCGRQRGIEPQLGQVPIPVFDRSRIWASGFAGGHTVRGQERAAAIPDGFPTVSFSVGLDLAPVDLSDDEEYQWMQALIWPEHRDRSARLSAARNVWLRSPPTVLQGDAVDLLPEALRRAPEDSTLCVFHCHTLNQFPTQTRERFESILKEASMHRTVYHMSSEGPRVSLSRIVGGDCSVLYSARRQVHGRWIEWDTHPRVS